MKPFQPSASGIDLWKLCNARAVGKYTHGIVETESDAMRNGTACHRVTQHFLVTGELPPMNAPLAKPVHKIVSALPVPGGSVAPKDIERVLVLPEFRGYMDWQKDNKQGDLKFTSSVSYQKDKDPTADTQRILYALDWYEQGGTGKLEQTWSVSQFNGAKAIPIKHVWSAKEARKKYSLHLAKDVDNFIETIQSKHRWDDEAVQKNYGSCNAFFKPCPMIEHGCKKNLAGRIKALQPVKVTL